MNEALLQALLRARLREDDIAAHLGVDPKTVRRWLNGRVPYPQNRAAIADLVGVDEADLWPGAGGPLTARARPGELGVVYPHRWAIPRDVWTQFFGAAEREIAILAYSALFLAEDEGILQILRPKPVVASTFASRSVTRTASTLPNAVRRRALAQRCRRRSGTPCCSTRHCARSRTSRYGCTTPSCTTRFTGQTATC